MRYTVSYWCASHIGRHRLKNQDNFFCGETFMEAVHKNTPEPLTGQVLSTDFSLFGIFDGMGGEECGEIASYIAAKACAGAARSQDAVAFFSSLCREANRQICSYASENGIFAMGTTAAMLAFTAKKITLCNIGDSKVFRFSDGVLKQISQDHVAVAAFGTKPPLSQNLGIPPTELEIQPYISQGSYRDKDLYLICSDGLTDMVSEDAIAQLLRTCAFADVGNALLEQALQAGGKDNITVLLLSVHKQGIFPIFKKHKGERKL